MFSAPQPSEGLVRWIILSRLQRDEPAAASIMAQADAVKV